LNQHGPWDFARGLRPMVFHLAAAQCHSPGLEFSAGAIRTWPRVAARRDRHPSSPRPASPPPERVRPQCHTRPGMRPVRARPWVQRHTSARLSPTGTPAARIRRRDKAQNSERDLNPFSRRITFRTARPPKTSPSNQDRM
jgi:hypothetical protein